jgi:hypothetical protein
MSEHTAPSSASHVNASHVENAFPTPPRAATPDPLLRVNGRLSPAPGKLLNMGRAQSTPPELPNDRHLRHISRGTTGDTVESSSLSQSWSRLHLSKKRSQYYCDSFAVREPLNTARERVIRDSMIVAEIKLNFCVS